MSNDPYQRRVKDVMSKVVVAVEADDTVRDALLLMEENRISALPVVDRRRHCVGIFSATDLIDLTRELETDLSDVDKLSDVSRLWLLETVADEGAGRRKVADVMSTTLAYVGPERPIAYATREMLRHRVHRLPVLDEQRRLLGIVSTMDLLGAFAEGAPV